MKWDLWLICFLECTKTTRQALNFCLAQCLSLVDPALLGQSRNKEDCVYNAKTGKMIRVFKLQLDKITRLEFKWFISFRKLPAAVMSAYSMIRIPQLLSLILCVESV